MPAPRPPTPASAPPTTTRRRRHHHCRRSSSFTTANTTPALLLFLLLAALLVPRSMAFLSPPPPLAPPASSAAPMQPSAPAPARATGAAAALGSGPKPLSASASGAAGSDEPPPAAAVAAAYEDALALYDRMRADTDPYMDTKVAAALDVVEQALRLYGPERCFASYNGGKDAVVVMHLFRAALAAYHHQNPSPSHTRPPRPRLIYFEQPTEFPEVKQLVADTARQYALDLRTYANVGFADGLRSCIDGEGGGALAFLLGTRKGDPNCKEQETFAPSSTWMPPFMRVNPILDWHYGHIWHFLRRYDLPYCSLYDQGYTSLGKVDDTLPNPALAKPNAPGEYYPAYMLQDWELERAGRVDKKKKLQQQADADVKMGDAECELRDFAEFRAKAQNAKTAGLIIIGDEILKGKTSDTNSLYAARKLRENGIQVQRIAVVQDEHDDILAEVQDQVHRFDVVITSGGVGATHDDVTIKAVAAALGQGISENDEMIRRIQEAYGVGSREELTDAQKSMALLPDLARLRVAPNAPSKVWPILQCENVFILPGVPQFFESKMDTIAAHFLGKRSLFTRKVVLGVDELEIVAALNEAVQAFQADVLFGSYPFYGEATGPRVIITLECPDEAKVDAAKEFVLARVQPEWVLKVANDDVLEKACVPDVIAGAAGRGKEE